MIMISVSDEQLTVIYNCIKNITRKYKLAGACLYGSKIAGYANEESDFDIIIVLENYSRLIKYVYINESKVRVSALVVDRTSLEKDAKYAFLGEFVIGRLLHIYHPIVNPELFISVETIYKKRVIIEEIERIVKSTNILSTEITFPLEFIMFSKIKSRALLYPNASYSYYKTYTCPYASRNTEAALKGFRVALRQILSEYKEVLSERTSDSMLQIHEKSQFVKKRTDTYTRSDLKKTKKLRGFSSYLIHMYAGRKTFQHVVKEAESKIRRYRRSAIDIPEFMSSPDKVFLEIPEGIMVIDDKHWLDEVSKYIGFSEYTVLHKLRLGTLTSRTLCYTLRDNNAYDCKVSIVVKDLSKLKLINSSSLTIANYLDDKSRHNPLIRLGTKYKAFRHIRSLGLNSPTIVSVIIAKRLFITYFLNGRTILDLIKDYSRESNNDACLYWLKLSGEQIAKIHSHKLTVGQLGPTDLIVSDQGLYFTGLEDFGFESADILRDIVYFLCSSTSSIDLNRLVASSIAAKFLEGYSESMKNFKCKTDPNLVRAYIESFRPLMSSDITDIIEKEIRTYLDS
jgi:tRNA A-37 threonylcarbamoyl transferase component Bud32/predicted nucleotidyltransferase